MKGNSLERYRTWLAQAATLYHPPRKRKSQTAAGEKSEAGHKRPSFETLPEDILHETSSKLREDLCRLEQTVLEQDKTISVLRRENARLMATNQNLLCKLKAHCPKRWHQALKCKDSSISLWQQRYKSLVKKVDLQSVETLHGHVKELNNSVKKTEKS